MPISSINIQRWHIIILVYLFNLCSYFIQFTAWPTIELLHHAALLKSGPAKPFGELGSRLWYQELRGIKKEIQFFKIKIE